VRNVKPLQTALVLGRKENAVLELLDHPIAHILLAVSDVVKDADRLPGVGVAQVSALATVAVEGLLVLHQPPANKTDKLLSKQINFLRGKNRVDS